MVLEKVNTEFVEMECEVIRISESSEMDSSDEIEEEFWAVMENVKPEVDNNPTISQVHLEEYSQSYEVSPPLRCRLCAIPDDDMVNIFDRNRTDRSIVEKIERCLPIVVRIDLRLSVCFNSTTSNILLSFFYPGQRDRSSVKTSVSVLPSESGTLLSISQDCGKGGTAATCSRKTDEEAKKSCFSHTIYQ